MERDVRVCAEHNGRTMTYAVKKSELKLQAGKIMEMLGISEHDIEFFKDHNVVKEHDGIKARTICMHEEIEPYVRTYEKETGSVVYAVIHSYTSFGELYAMLIVPKFVEDWDKLVIPSDNGRFLVYAYVRNVDNDECSESGYVVVESKNGILSRVG